MSKHDTRANSRLRITSDKIYYDICKFGLFGKEYISVVDAIAKKNAYTYNKIKPLFDELLEQKQIVLKDGKIENNMKTVQGKIITKAGENFGHVRVGDKDIYVNDRNLALDGDDVEIALRQAYGKLEGVIIKIVKRAYDNITGVVVKSGKEYKFIPSNKKFDIPVVLCNKDLSEMVGKKVKVRLVYADPKMAYSDINPVVGFVEKVYGLAGDPIIENIVIAETYGFTKEFPSEVSAEADIISDVLTKEDEESAIDMTDIPFCTIDPKTCKDIDDAIYVERKEDGFVAYVALADVQHYVKAGSAMDIEAMKRGTSCYLGDGVYPMLPEKISNGICSLNPDEKRRAIVGVINIDNKGNIQNYDFFQAVVRSRRKLSYEDAQDIYDGKMEVDETLKKNIEDSFALSDRLVQMRRERGALTLNNSEPTFILNENKTGVEDIVDKTVIPSTKVIESLMILYNEAVGDLVDKKNLVTVFRTHEAPDKSQVSRIKNVCEELGIKYDGDASSQGLRRLVESVRGLPCERFINNLVLTNMKKASYSEINKHHFALASKNYIHSTAAIRRYPDIITQRVLVNYMNKKRSKVQRDDLYEIAKYLSTREIEADKAERESDDLMKTIWAEGQLNKEFNARISKINTDGVFAEIDKEGVSVFIPLKDLIVGNSKIYKPNDTKTKLVNKKLDKEISIGDEIKVVITDTDRNTRSVKGESLRINEIRTDKKEKEEEVKQNLTEYLDKEKQKW